MVTVVRQGSFWDWRRVLAALRFRGDQLLQRHRAGRVRPGVRPAAGGARAIVAGDQRGVPDHRHHPPAVDLRPARQHPGRRLVVGAPLPAGRAADLAADRRPGSPWAYALLTDANPPVVRAVILTVVFCLARLFGRRDARYNTLAAGALVVVAVNPAHLFLAGTQLSFLAVLTIFWITSVLPSPAADDPLQQLIAQSRPWPIRAARQGWRAVWQLTALSAAIWVVAAPLTAYYFHVISPIALPLNPLVSLPVSLAMLSGFAVLVCGWLLPPLAAVCGGVCTASLTCLEWLVQYGQQVPGAY